MIKHDRGRFSVNIIQKDIHNIVFIHIEDYWGDDIIWVCVEYKIRIFRFQCMSVFQSS